MQMHYKDEKGVLVPEVGILAKSPDELKGRLILMKGKYIGTETGHSIPVSGCKLFAVLDSPAKGVQFGDVVPTLFCKGVQLGVPVKHRKTSWLLSRLVSELSPSEKRMGGVKELFEKVMEGILPEPEEVPIPFRL